MSLLYCYFAELLIFTRACTFLFFSSFSFSFFFFSREKNQRGKETLDQSGWVCDMDNHQQTESAPHAGRPKDLSGTSTAAAEPESFYSLKDRINWLEQHLVEKVNNLYLSLLFKKKMHMRF